MYVTKRTLQNLAHRITSKSFCKVKLDANI